MKFLTESARIAKAYGMVMNESVNVPKKVCEGWNSPKVDVARLTAALDSAKSNGNDADICPPVEVFGSVKEEGLPSFDAYVDERGNVVLEEGLKMVDGNEHGEGHWIKGFDRKGYDASIDGFMMLVSGAYADASEDGDEVLEWKVVDVLPNGDDRSYHRYVVSVSPYFIDWSKEYVGKDGKVVKRDESFGESVEDGGDGEFSKKVFFLDIRVPHPSDEDDETFEDMKYSATFTKLADAVKTAKDAYAEYVKEYPEIEVNIWGGEERRPEGDIYGEPWVYCTVKVDGCDFSDEQIAEEDAHDDYFLWRSEKAEKGNADVKESEEVGDEATIGNIDDMEDVEDTETFTPEAERMVERDSVGWSNFGSNMPDNHVAFKNPLVVSSSYNNGIVGQSNLIAVLKRLEEAGFKSGTDFGVLSAGGFGGHAYYLWYDRDNVKLANTLSVIEKELEDYVLLDEDLHSAMESYLCDWYWNDADEGTKAEYYEKHGEKVPDVRPIPKPEFYNDNGDVTSMTAEQTLADPDLKKMAEEYGLELPKSYFE